MICDLWKSKQFFNFANSAIKIKKPTELNIIFLIIILLISNCFNCFAKVDSVGIEQNGDEQFILHKVEKGEGVNYIASKYNITVKKIKKINPDLKGWVYENQIIKIPVEKEKVVIKDEKKIIESTQTVSDTNNKITIEKTNIHQEKKNSNISTDNFNKIPVYHKVIKDQTLYSIADKYQTTTENIIAWNNMKSSNIDAGQELIVSWLSLEAELRNDSENKNRVSTAEQPEKLLDDSVEIKVNKLIKKLEIKKEEERKAKEKSIEDLFAKTIEINEKCIAVNPIDINIDNNRYFALHKTAPEGTIIKVEITETQKEIYVKVTGKIPENQMEYENIGIILSRKAVEKLGYTTGERFEVNHSFTL